MSCPFCAPKAWEVFYEGPLVIGMWNGYPVSPGHALLVTRRHVRDWFEATPEEQAELGAATAVARQAIQQKHRPDGYNIGTNVGEAGGQTIFHLHLHVLPRYAGQRPTPGGEADHLIPGPYHLRLKMSNFLRDLAEHLREAQAFDFMAREELQVQAAIEEMVARGGQVRAKVGDVPLEYFRVRDLQGRETVWLGGPGWHYTLLPTLDRDGQRELRKAFEDFWAREGG